MLDFEPRLRLIRNTLPLPNVIIDLLLQYVSHHITPSRIVPLAPKAQVMGIIDGNVYSSRRFSDRPNDVELLCNNQPMGFHGSIYWGCIDKYKDWLVITGEWACFLFHPETKRVMKMNHFINGFVVSGKLYFMDDKFRLLHMDFGRNGFLVCVSRSRPASTYVQIGEQMYGQQWDNDGGCVTFPVGSDYEPVRSRFMYLWNNIVYTMDKTGIYANGQLIFRHRDYPHEKYAFEHLLLLVYLREHFLLNLSTHRSCHLDTPALEVRNGVVFYTEEDSVYLF